MIKSMNDVHFDIPLLANSKPMQPFHGSGVEQHQGCTYCVARKASTYHHTCMYGYNYICIYIYIHTHIFKIIKTYTQLTSCQHISTPLSALKNALPRFFKTLLRRLVGLLPPGRPPSSLPVKPCQWISFNHLLVGG